MSFGIEAYGAYGDDLFSTQFQPYSIIQEGTVVCNQTSPDGSIAVGYVELGSPTLPFATGELLVVVKLKTSPSKGVGAYVSFSTRMNFENTVTDMRFVTASFATGTSIEYKFLKPEYYPTPSSDSYGLQVFAADGALVFDSGYQLPNSSDIQHVQNTVPPNPQYATYTALATRTIPDGYDWVLGGTATGSLGFYSIGGQGFYDDIDLGMPILYRKLNATTIELGSVTSSYNYHSWPIMLFKFL